MTHFMPYLFKFTDSGWAGGSPTNIQSTRVRPRGMSNPRKLKLLLAENTNEMGADPSSHSNNFAQSDQSAPGPVMNSTTTFTTDADAVTSSISHPQRINSLLTTSSSLEMDQTIKDFLAKPVALQTGVLSSTDTVSTFPSLLLPYGPLFDTMYKAKVSGFLGFRATMVFRLVINANRFQQGRYMLAFVPSCGSDILANAGNLRYLAHTNTLVQRTQLPRIELDLACDTEGTLRIPYTSVQNFYPLRSTSLATGFGSWGKAQVFPYSALVAPTGSATCPYTVFMHFENVELSRQLYLSLVV
jgi:hypothetical protein